MNQVEKKLMDEFACAAMQAAIQAVIPKINQPGVTADVLAEQFYIMGRAMVQARAKAQGSHYIKNEVFPL